MTTTWTSRVLAGTSLFLALRCVATADEAALLAILAPVGGEHGTIDALGSAQNAIKEHGPDARRLEALGWAFVARARETRDDGNYTLALVCVDEIEQRFGISDSTLLLRGHLLHNTHAFAAAESVARELVQRRGLPVDHGLLSDTLMEQGRIEEAVAECQKFVDGQPGLQSYLRAAHLRWLTGDVEGAANLTITAIRASAPDDREGRAWALARLAHLQLHLGNPRQSAAIAEQALQLVSGYAPALFERGRALLALGHASDAAALLGRAAETTSLPEHRWWWAEALRTTGDSARADEIERLISRHGAAADPRTTGLFFASTRLDTARAVELCRAELSHRRDALTYDALAFSLFAHGQLDDATEAASRALATGTRDARIHLHAAMIFEAAGMTVEAGRSLTAAASGAATLLPSERILLRSGRQTTRETTSSLLSLLP